MQDTFVAEFVTYYDQRYRETPTQLARQHARAQHRAGRSQSGRRLLRWRGGGR